VPADDLDVSLFAAGLDTDFDDRRLTLRWVEDPATMDRRLIASVPDGDGIVSREVLVVSAAEQLRLRRDSGNSARVTREAIREAFGWRQPPTRRTIPAPYATRIEPVLVGNGEAIVVNGTADQRWEVDGHRLVVGWRAVQGQDDQWELRVLAHLDGGGVRTMVVRRVSGAEVMAGVAGPFADALGFCGAVSKRTVRDAFGWPTPETRPFRPLYSYGPSGLSEPWSSRPILAEAWGVDLESVEPPRRRRREPKPVLPDPVLRAKGRRLDLEED
jgi:hypothetical protein